MFQHLYFYHYDHLGSVRLVTAAKNWYGDGHTWTQLTQQGTIYQRTDYLPFGEIFHDSNAAYTANPDNDFFRSREKYTGKQWDYLTGLYYYGARMYDPQVGQFTQADSVIPRPSEGQAFNRYAYANNNPYKYIDPSGHNPLASFIIGLVESIIVGVCFAINPVFGMCVAGLISAIHAIIGGATGGAVLMAFAQGFIMSGVASIPGIGLALAAYGIYQAIASNSPDAMAACLGGLIGGQILRGLNNGPEQATTKTSSGDLENNSIKESAPIQEENITDSSVGTPPRTPQESVADFQSNQMITKRGPNVTLAPPAEFRAPAPMESMETLSNGIIIETRPTEAIPRDNVLDGIMMDMNSVQTNANNGWQVDAQATLNNDITQPIMLHQAAAESLPPLEHITMPLYCAVPAAGGIAVGGVAIVGVTVGAPVTVPAALVIGVIAIGVGAAGGGGFASYECYKGVYSH